MVPRSVESERRRPRLAAYGMAFPFAYISFFFRYDGLPIPPKCILGSPYPAMVVLCVAVFAVSRARGPRVPGCSSRAPLLVADAASCAAMVAAAPLLEAWHLHTDTAWLFFGGAVLVGLGVGWSYIRWGVVYTGFEMREAVRAICLSVAMAAVAKAVLCVCPRFVLPVAMGASGIASFACLRVMTSCLSLRQEPKERGTVGRPRCVRELWPFMIALVALCAALGCLYNVGPAREGGGVLSRLGGYLLEAVGALAVFWWVCRKKKPLGVSGITAALAVVIALGLLVLGLEGPVSSTLFFLLTNVDHSLLTLFLWIVLADVAQWGGVGPYEAFAAGWVLRSAPFWAAGALTVSFGLELTSNVGLVLMFATLCVLVLVLMGQGMGGRFLLASLDGVPRADVATLESQCAGIADERGLTPREREVLVLLCRGRSRPYIAESLYLSENTVRSYTKNLYKKLEVHDRQSLLQLVDAYTPDSGVAGGAPSHPAGY